MDDIKIKSNGCLFKIRVCGIIKIGKKILVQRMKNNEDYCFPGGHLKLNELTEECVIREIKEELNIDTKIVKLICINENAYKKENEDVQEFGFYFVLKTKNVLPKEDFSLTEVTEKGLKEQHYHWVSLFTSEMKKIHPSILAKILDSEENKLKYIVTKS